MHGRVIRFLAPFLSKKEDRSDHGALLTTLHLTFEEVAENIQETLKNTNFRYALGNFLDLWGKIYGVVRRHGEDDDQYRDRIILEITTQRQTVESLVRIIDIFSPHLTKEDITIFEPFRHLYAIEEGFKLNENLIPDYQYWTWAIIDIQTPKPVNEESRMKVEQFKAFGVKVHYTISYAHPQKLFIKRPISSREGTQEFISIHHCLQDYTISGETGLLNGGGQVL